MGRLVSRASFACAEGVLLIATPQTEMRLRWQPHPLAEQRLPGGHWQPFIPEFRFLAPADTTQGTLDPAVADKYQALLAFRSAIPANLALAVEPFRSHQWPLLHLLAASAGARDLVRSNPVLAYAVALNHEIRLTPLAVAADHAVRHCHQKQREIARWLGFPDAEAMVRLFRKIPLDLASPTLLRLLRNAVATPEGLERFGRLPGINMGLIHLLGQPSLTPRVTWSLVLEVAASADERETASTGDALIDIMAMLGEMLALGNPAPFNSIRQVESFRETVSREYLRRGDHSRRERLKVRGHSVAWVELPCLTPPPPPAGPAGAVRRPAPRPGPPPPTRKRDKTPFPPPPIPGTPAIRALTTPDDLITEGIFQRNCVGNESTYEPHIRKGRCYIYRVMYPDRATLSLIRRGINTWTIGELKAARNVPVTPATRRAVHDWLDANQVSL